jgi:two-component system cell cycle response regulator
MSPVALVAIAELVILCILVGLALRLRSVVQRSIELECRDELTGLRTLRYFWEDLEVEVERMSRDKRPLSIVYLDVGGFDPKVAEDVLMAMGFVIKDSTRSLDSSARLERGEFAIVLQNADEKVANIVVERIRSKFAAVIQSKQFRATLSIGIAAFKGTPVKIQADVTRRRSEL